MAVTRAMTEPSAMSGVARPISAAITVFACALVLTGCRTGDFGRERTNLIPETVLPVVGFVSTYTGGEPVSHFNYTNDEQTLRDLGWGMVVPTHAEDWIGRTAFELQRYEIIRRADLLLSPDRYHAILRSDRYASSDARYARIMDDAAADMAAIGPYFAYSQRVRLADDDRLAAAIALPDLTARELAATHGRIAENQRQRAWVKRALLFRLYAYRNAVDRLMIETPSHLAGTTIARLDALEAMILQAIEQEVEDITINHPGQMVDLLELVAKA